MQSIKQKPTAHCVKGWNLTLYFTALNSHFFHWKCDNTELRKKFEAKFIKYEAKLLMLSDFAWFLLYSDPEYSGFKEFQSDRQTGYKAGR